MIKLKMYKKEVGLVLNHLLEFVLENPDNNTKKVLTEEALKYKMSLDIYNKKGGN